MNNISVAWFIFGTVCLFIATNILAMGLMRAAKDPRDEIEMK